MGSRLSPYLVFVPRPTVIEDWSALVGLNYESFAYILGLYLCYPLGALMNLVPSSSSSGLGGCGGGDLKHLFSGSLGIVLLQTVLGVQYLHLVVSSTLAYLMLRFLPRRSSVVLVPALSVGYAVAGHLHNQYMNYMSWNLDFTGPQMVLTLKLYSLAYNLYDGWVMESCERGVGEVPRGTRRCKGVALRECPTPVEFFGYVFCFSNVLAGPGFEFKGYRDAVTGKNLERGGVREGPSRLGPVVVPLLVSLYAMVFYVQVGGMYPIMDPDDPQRNTPVFVRMGEDGTGWRERFLYQVRLGGGGDDERTVVNTVSRRANGSQLSQSTSER